jgi:eukaryotic-like serine/threonine-protein kinase
LYSLNAVTGKLNWKIDFGKSLDYAWGFDYYYSSPTVIDNKILIGSKDGFVYNVSVTDGKTLWKFKTDGIVRSTPAVKDNTVFFGDTDGLLYAVDLNTGKETWRFKTFGNGFNNENFGFDRRAIISSPTIANDKVIFGCRDGFFYAVNISTGKELWHVDHEVSWVISSVAVKDSIVVTGTSDGRFVQAVSVNTGKQIWKFKTVSIVWSSPVIYNNKVYIGSQEGVLYCLDLYTGRRISFFQSGAKIFTSPVINDSLLFFGTDGGYFYALHPSKYTYPEPKNIKRYVFWQQSADAYFHYGNNEKIKIYLNVNHYETIDEKQLAEVLRKKDSATNSVIVFAQNFFPKEIYDGYDKSLLREYLNAGGRIVLLGMNPLIYEFDSSGNLYRFNFPRVDSVLSIHYGPNDLRSTGGLVPAFPTEEGERWGLKNAWTSFLALDPNQVNVVLGKDENGKTAAWVKKYSEANGSGFIQIWIDPDFVDDMSQVIRVAEHGLE